MTQNEREPEAILQGKVLSTYMVIDIKVKEAIRTSHSSICSRIFINLG